MSYVREAIANDSDDLDDIRYKHHLRHEGQANHRIFWTFWLLVGAFLTFQCVSRAYTWWRCRT
jgi:hypothetical protein